jgi:small subunit ribosomal protein S2
MADKSSSAPNFEEMLKAGLHFGHQTKRWNPKMKRYIFGKRNGIHIIDLAKTEKLMGEALDFVSDTIMRGRKVLLVGTKKQAREIIQQTAEATGQPYVVNRWLGGMLTNAKTIRNSISRMQELEAMLAEGSEVTRSKRELSRLGRELEKLQSNLNGIRDLDRLPGAVLVIDMNRESNAVKEARCLHIPIVATLDTNCDPDPIDYPIPANDDSIRAIKLIMGKVEETIKAATQRFEEIAAAQKLEREKAESEERAKAEAAAKARRKKDAADKEARRKAVEKAKSKLMGEAAKSAEKDTGEAPVASAPAAAEQAAPESETPAAEQVPEVPEAETAMPESAAEVAPESAEKSEK